VITLLIVEVSIILKHGVRSHKPLIYFSELFCIIVLFVSGSDEGISKRKQEVSVDHVQNMVAITLAKPPQPLSLEDTTHRGEKWKQFKQDWTYCETASKINKEEGPIRVGIKRHW